jgi:hypothetical protein
MMSSMSLASSKGKAAQEQDMAAAEVAAEAGMVDKDEAVAEAEGTSSASAVVIKMMSWTVIAPLPNTLIPKGRPL